MEVVGVNSRKEGEISIECTCTRAQKRKICEILNASNIEAQFHRHSKYIHSKY